MPQDWFEWVGRTIADDIPLLEFLGGSGDTAVFSTAIMDRQGVVKLVVMEPDKAKARLATFKAAEKLSHPHLLRVFRTGKCQVDEENLIYMVTEFAAENVAQVLPERNLTTEESRALLSAALPALQYLHAQGFVHADLKPSHIMATGNQVKLSVDGVHRANEPLARTTVTPYDAPEAKAVLTPASDMWSLGVTLAKVLTQRVAESPKDADKYDPPFRDIVMRCLAAEPDQRPSVIDVYNILDGKEVPAPASSSSQTFVEPVISDDEYEPQAKSTRPKLKHHSKSSSGKSSKVPLLAFGAVAVIILVVALYFGLSHRQSQTETAGETPQSSSQSSSASNPVQAKAAVSLPSNSKPPDITRRFIPQVSPEAQGTITGTVRVGVKVMVDPKGNVVDTDLMALGPSQYFDNLATEAAREWKFGPSQKSTAWELQFNFTRKGTTVVPTLVSH